MIERVRDIAARPAARVAASLVGALVLAVLVWPRPVPVESAVSWETLIAPLAVGESVHDGYILSPPRRGAEHDVVFVVRRPAGSGAPASHVEVHVVDRGHWDVPETASFGVAWEEPRSSATLDEKTAVTTRIREAISANDPGGLGPVDSIPLHSPAALPPIARSLGALSGLSAWGAALALLVLVMALGSLRRGTLWLSVVLGVLGGGLRVAHLGVPFVRDQDVQRIVTGSYPLVDIATGQGLMDRHPPAYFFVLHFAQWAGQDEWIVRLPAAVIGALAAPVILWACRSLRAPAEPAAAATALLIAASPALVAASREVSDIPMFAAVLVAMVGLASRTIAEPTRVRCFGLAVLVALAFWTYYLAPFAIAGSVAILVVGYRRTPIDDRAKLFGARATARWIALGVLAGAPAMLLAAMTLFRDFDARSTARAFPELAWGDWTAAEMSTRVASVVQEAVGLPMLVLFLVAGTATCLLLRKGLARPFPSEGADRSGPSVTPFLAPAMATAMVFGVGLGIVSLTPIARVQPYYAISIVPLVSLVVASAAESFSRRARVAFSGAAGAACIVYVASNLAAGAQTYIADPSIPRQVSAAEARGVEQIVTVAHYDALLVAYYLARAHGQALRGHSITRTDSGRLCINGINTCVAPLILSHGVRDQALEQAPGILHELLSQRRSVVLTRDTFRVDGVERVLGRCRSLDMGTTTTLLDCTDLRR